MSASGEAFGDQDRGDPWWGRLPRVVWAATLVWIGLLLLWTILVPTFRAADENQHVSAGVHLEHHRTWPGFKELEPDLGVQRAMTAFRVVQISTDPHPPLESSGAVSRGSRPSFTGLGAGASGSGVLTVGQHPPGYYVLIGSISWILPSGVPGDLEVWILRVVSVVMMAPLPVVVAAMVRRLGGTASAVATGAILPFSVPELAVVSSAANSDNLLNAAAIWAMLGVVLVASGDLRVRTGSLIGLAMAVGLFAKAFALLLVPVVVAAYLLGGRRSGRWQSCLPGLGAFIAASFLGGWWWFHNLVRYGQVQPSGHGWPRPEGRLGLAEGFGDYLRHLGERVPGRFWASLGVKGDGVGAGGAFSPVLVGLLSLLLVGILVAAVARRSTYRADRADVILLLTPLVLVAGTLVVSTWNIYSRTGYPAGLQGRYLFVALPGVFVVLALVLSRWTSRWPQRRLPVMVATFSGALVLLAIFRAARFHWGADRSSVSDVPAAIFAWSPLPVWATGTVMGLVLLALVPFVLSLRELGAASHGEGSIGDRENAASSGN